MQNLPLTGRPSAGRSMKISTAGLLDALRGVLHNLIRKWTIFFPCGHGRSGRQQKDKRVFHAFRLTERHKINKQSIGKAQPMLTRVGGGALDRCHRWSWPGVRTYDVVRNVRYHMFYLYRMQNTMS